MDEIASQLGISKKTIYQYFADKEEIVSAVLEYILQSNINCCTESLENAENPIHEIFLAFDRMRQMFRNVNPAILFDLQKYHPKVFERFQQYKYGFLYSTIKNNLERGIESGLYRNDIDIDIITRFRIESAMLPFNQQVFPNNQSTLLEIEEALSEHYLFGIATTKGYEIIINYKKQRQTKPHAK